MTICRTASRLATDDEFGEVLANVDLVEYQFANPRETGAAPNALDDPFKRSAVTLQQELDPSVRQVTHVPAEVFGLGLAPNEVAKADALYATGNKSFKTANWRHAEIQ